MEINGTDQVRLKCVNTCDEMCLELQPLHVSEKKEKKKRTQNYIERSKISSSSFQKFLYSK